MKILVIGGTGFIGTPVVNRLSNLGHDVNVFHRGETNAEFPPEVRQLFGNRQQLSDFAPEFNQLSPQIVLDIIPYLEQDAVAVMQTFRGIAERVVAISSQDVYRTYGVLWGKETGEPNSTPISEDAPLRSVLYPYRSLAKDENDLKYNYDKILVERVFMSDTDLPATILRLPAVYGIGDKNYRWFEYLKRMDDGRELILLNQDNAKWRWTRGYIENVADAIALAVMDERAANRIYNVGESDTLTESEWVRSIGQIVGWKGEIVVAPNEALPQHLKAITSFDHDLIVDTSLIRKELNYAEKISRVEALSKTIAWERENPPPQIDPAQFDYAAENTAFQALNQNKGGVYDKT